MSLFQYIVLHQSVRNHPGVCAVQAAHAAGEAIKTPIGQDTTVCALMAETSEAIEELSMELGRNAVQHVVIREPDEPYFGAATALGITPVTFEMRDRIRPLFKQFPLLRPEE